MILTMTEILNLSKLFPAWEAIKNAEKITFLTHHNPDADGVSACAALSYIAEKMGKQVEAIYPTRLDATVYAQPKNVCINQHEQIPDLLIACDTANYERLYFPEVFASIPLINIDHHISNKINGSYNFVASDTSSTCEVLYHLIKKWAPNIFDQELASRLLFGILYDTQVFQIQMTSATTLRVAADLVEHGADLFYLKTLLLSNKNPEVLRFWGALLSRITFSASKKSAWVFITQKDCAEYGLSTDALLGLNNFMAQITEIDVIMVAYEMKNGTTKISLRSKETDVNKLAQQFDGGGHKNAAGIMMKKPLTEAIQELTKQLP